MYHSVGRAAMNAAIRKLLLAGWKKSDVELLVGEVESRLKSDPQGFGEPHFSIRGTNLKVSVGFVRPLSVQIGIHEQLRIVFIRKVTLMTTDKD